MGFDPYAPSSDPRSTSYEGPPPQAWWDDPELTVIDGPPLPEDFLDRAVEALSEPTAPVPAELTDGYGASDVPSTAADVVAWIKDAEGDDAEARAVATLAVERERDKMRATVVTAIEGVTGLIGD